MDKTLGIIGGGQLGKMLLQYCSRISLKTNIYDPSDECPCKFLCNSFHKGEFMSYEDIVEFGKKCDLLTYEIEHINVDALKHLENLGISVYPKSETLRVIQDKNEQKKFFFKNNLPTSDFNYYSKKSDIKRDIFQNKIKFPCVWKKTRFGYDGFGVKVLKTITDLDNIPNDECIIEDYVDISKELSVIVARNIKGEYKAYPPVEMIFNNETNQVEYVVQPANIDEEILEKVMKLSNDLSHCLNHIGILAIEMFISSKGDILINELAPRPHNSGHLTIEHCCPTSQFEQHIRSILDLPLGETSFRDGAIMANIVGEEGYSGKANYIGIENLYKSKNTYLHIYGKEETRPNRKMGHFTIVGSDDLINRAKTLKGTIKVIV